MRDRAAAVIQGINDGWLQMEQTTGFALGDAPSAHHALEGRTMQGKLALVLARYGLGVQSRGVVAQSALKQQGTNYGPGSPRQRHND